MSDKSPLTGQPYPTAEMVRKETELKIKEMSDKLPWPSTEGFNLNTQSHEWRYMLSEYQARALYEGSKMILELNAGNFVASTTSNPYWREKMEEFAKALSLLKKGLGRE